MVEGEEDAEGAEGEEGDDGACVRMWCVMVASFILLQQAILFKVLEKCTENLIGHCRLAFNKHESNIDC